MMDGERAQIKMRKKGFYWVKFQGEEWLVAQWDGEYWMFPGDDRETPGVPVTPTELEVNETRIVNPDEEDSGLPIWDGKASGGGTFERGE